MNKVRTLILTLGGVLLAGAGYLVFGSGGAGADVDPLAETDWNSSDPDHLADGPMVQADGTGPMRAELAGGAAAGEGQEDEGDDPPRHLAMSGRVFSDAGPAIAGARVTVTYRRSFGAAGGAANFGRGGGGQEARQAFRSRPAAEPSITDSEGRFRLAGKAFGESSLEIEVTHVDYAPMIVRRDWRTAEGAIQVDDIVLGAGVTVTGFVLDSNSRPLVAAAVQYSESGRGGFGRGGGGGPGGRGNRGGGGRGGFEGSRLEELVGGTKTNEAGFFQLTHVPAGEFRLRASAPKHLDANSPPITAKSGERADAGELRLVIGVELRGVVLDAAGAPVVDARVQAGSSRELMQAAFSAVREDGVDPMEVARRFMGIERRTRTDKKGEFVLDSLPPAPLRLTVEHPRFVNDEREPIDPTKETRVVVRMQPALAVTGRVVDEQTGQPLDRFAIAVRPMDNNGGGFGGFGGRGGDNGGGRRGRGGDPAAPAGTTPTPRAVATADAGAEGQAQGRGRRGGGRGDEQDPAAAAAAAARDAQRQADRAVQEAQRTSREAYLRDRLGPTGRIPRDPGRPAAHAGGQFEVGGLQPGRYTIDVSAPDYVMMAAGPVELLVGQGAAEVTIPLRKGARVIGRVEDRVTHNPVAGARVELLLPELETAPTTNPDNPFANFRRNEGGQQRLQNVRTDAEGKFAFKPVRGGAYWLRIEADGYNGLLERTLFVTDGRDTDNFTFPLIPASEVHGVVRNGTPGTRYTIAFMTNTGRRVTARTDAEHRYRIESIEVGSYWVTLETGEAGGGRGGFGAMGGRVLEMMRGDTRADVVITEGSKVQYDLDARAVSPGVVQGSVAFNGAPGSGFDVSLTPVQPAGAAGANGNGMERMVGRMMGRGLSARTDEEGKFEIERVPAGSYELEVRRGGGGGGGRGGRGGRGGGGGGGGTSIHSEPVDVSSGSTIIRRVVLSAGALALTVEQEADGKPVARASATLVLRTEANGKAPEAWRDLPSFRNAQLRDGKAEIRDLKVGEWQLRIQGQGIATQESTVYVQQSAEPTEFKLKVKAGATAPGGAPAPGGRGN